jgi:glutamate dehydrogenase
MHVAWKNDLAKLLEKEFGAKKGTDLNSKYEQALHGDYLEDVTAGQAMNDIRIIEALTPENPVDLALYQVGENEYHLRLFQFSNPIPLSDVLPMLENLGLRTLDERPYKVALADKPVWISDFTVVYARGQMVLADVKEIFREAFIKTGAGFAENDGFNKLVLSAGLAWDEIIIVRAYAKYLRQAGFAFSQNYIEDTLVNNADITKNLIALFKARFAIAGCDCQPG